MSCDLHIHSTCSDGAVPIERLASIAARTGLHAIALSDHDTLLSAQYAYAHTGQDGVELIPAVELTGYDFDRQHRVHLLCYYPDLEVGTQFFAHEAQFLRSVYFCHVFRSFRV